MDYVALIHDPSFDTPELRTHFREIRNCDDDEQALKTAHLTLEEGETVKALARVVWSAES